MTVPKTPFGSTISPFGTVISPFWYCQIPAATKNSPGSREAFCFPGFGVSLRGIFDF